MKNNILLISENDEFAGEISKKLLFLRAGDTVQTSNYNDAMCNVELSGCDIVIVHEFENRQRTLDLVSALHKNLSLSVILLVNAIDSDFVLAGYDCGIDDFISADAQEFEFVVRTVNNIKHNSVKNKFQRTCKILEQLKVIDELTGVYNYDFSKQAVENFIDDNLLSSGTFLALSTFNKTDFEPEKISDALKQSTRIDDIITFGKGLSFYLFLPEIDLNGAIIVFNKIKEICELDLCAGITSIEHKDFVTFEKEALQALCDAQATHAEYILVQNKEQSQNDWLDTPKSGNYKLFKKVYSTKLEKIIAPVFYRLQKVYEDKLFKTKIEQYTDAEQCVFNLKNEKLESSLKFVYPGFANIIIYITHAGLDSPENEEYQLPLNKITTKEISDIVEQFILAFKKETR